MISEHVSLLGQKIECAKFDMSLYPLLSDTSVLLTQSCAAVISDVCNASVELGKVKVGMRAGQKFISDCPMGTALYRASNPEGVESILIAIPPELVASVSESLLGGEFYLPETPVDLTTLDLELSQAVPEELIKVLNCHIVECGVDEGSQRLSITRSAIVTEEVLKEIPESIFFGISVDLDLGLTSLSRAISVYLPIEFIDRHGFLEKARKNSNDGVEQTQWHSDVQANVEQCQVELGVELGRLKTSISDLSRLDIGQIIPLEGRTVHTMDVTMKSNMGLIHLGVGQLGRCNKSKAIKLAANLKPTLRVNG